MDANEFSKSMEQMRKSFKEQFDHAMSEIHARSKQIDQSIAEMQRHQQQTATRTSSAEFERRSNPATEITMDGSFTADPGNFNRAWNECPKFYGTNTRLWIKECEQFFDLFKIPDYQKVDMASLHMFGRAKIWIELYYDDGRSMIWEEMIVDLLVRFRDNAGVNMCESNGKLEIAKENAVRPKIEEDRFVDDMIGSTAVVYEVQKDELKEAIEHEEERNQLLETEKVSTTIAPEVFDESPKKPRVLKVEADELVVMASVAPAGSQFNTRQFDYIMTELLGANGEEFFTSYDEVHDSFDTMGLQENLLIKKPSMIMKYDSSHDWGGSPTKKKHVHVSKLNPQLTSSLAFPIEGILSLQGAALFQCHKKQWELGTILLSTQFATTGTTQPILFSTGTSSVGLVDERCNVKLEEHTSNDAAGSVASNVKGTFYSEGKFCDATNKVYFILKHKNPKTGEFVERHVKFLPSVSSDKLFHVYTAILKPNNEVQILIDGEEKKKVNLLYAEDFEQANFELDKPDIEPIAVIGMEIWTMKDGILFDNILITSDENVAESYRNTVEAKNSLTNYACNMKIEATYVIKVNVLIFDPGGIKRIDVAASEQEITEPYIFSVEYINYVEAEVLRLEELEASQMKVLVFKKRSELEAICRKTHMIPESDNVMGIAIDAIETGVMDPTFIFEQIKLQIGNVETLKEANVPWIGPCICHVIFIEGCIAACTGAHLSRAHEDEGKMLMVFTTALKITAEGCPVDKEIDFAINSTAPVRHGSYISYIAPDGKILEESNKNLDEVVALAKESDWLGYKSVFDGLSPGGFKCDVKIFDPGGSIIFC